MSSRITRSNRLAWASAVALAAVLAACGGGGGDGDDSGPPGTIDLTVANRDTVAHATAAGAMGLGGADRVVSVGGSVATQRHVAQALRTTRERPLGVVGPINEPCLVSGSTITSLDDRDNDGVPSPGDALTIQFVQCKDSVEETVSGTMSLTITQLRDTALGGSLRQDAFSVVREDAGQQHALTLTGTMQLSYTESSPDAATLRLVADGAVRANVSTPIFTDVVTLADGYVQESVIDLSVPPPPGSFTPGRVSTTSSGRMNSQAAGGDVTVATTTPIAQYSDDEFPRAGVLLVTGRTGTLRISALSTVEVQLGLDTDGNGTTDVTTLERWDWLI